MYRKMLRRFLDVFPCTEQAVMGAGQIPAPTIFSRVSEFLRERISGYSAPMPRYSLTFSPAKLSAALFSGVRSDTRKATKNDAAME